MNTSTRALWARVLDVTRGIYYTEMVKSPQGFFIYSTLLMSALITYLKHVREEFSHIVWPSTRTAVSHTLVVLLISAVIVVIVGILDYLFSSAVSRIVG